MILGIDEVGRGCWAGPLVVGAVILDSTHIDGLTDSKALSKRKREQLNVDIYRHATATGLGWVTALELDTIGMSASLRLATRRAVEQVRTSKQPFSEIIIDGTVNFLEDTPLSAYVTTLKKADLLIQSVSAASIIAKVARDNYMLDQSVIYPQYKFESNVGYGALFHRQAIERYGVTPLHRLSFKPLTKFSTGSDVSTDRYTVKAKTTKVLGDSAEGAVSRYLEAHGHTIVERNWRTKWCEIDIVSRKGEKIYFTEVKYRKKHDRGSSVEAITPKKLKQMTFASELYVQSHNIPNAQRQLAGAGVSGSPATIDIYLEIM